MAALMVFCWAVAPASNAMGTLVPRTWGSGRSRASWSGRAGRRLCCRCVHDEFHGEQAGGAGAVAAGGEGGEA